MKKLLLFPVTVLGCLFAMAQVDTVEAIVAEGKRLFRSEMASWYGTDIFMERFQHHKEKIGGYVSYEFTIIRASM